MRIVEQKVSAGGEVFDLIEFLARPLFAHLAIVLCGGLWLPPPVVAWFQHVASLFCQHVHPEVDGGWDAHRETVANLMIDTTAAPARNDPEFEAAFDPIRVKLLSGFRRAAVLVKTTVGRLQADRHQRQDKTGAQTVPGELKFAVCTETTCDPQRSPVAIELDVK